MDTQLRTFPTHRRNTAYGDPQGGNSGTGGGIAYGGNYKAIAKEDINPGDSIVIEPDGVRRIKGINYKVRTYNVNGTPNNNQVIFTAQDVNGNGILFYLRENSAYQYNNYADLCVNYKGTSTIIDEQLGYNSQEAVGYNIRIIETKYKGLFLLRYKTYKNNQYKGYIKTIKIATNGDIQPLHILEADYYGYTDIIEMDYENARYYIADSGNIVTITANGGFGNIKKVTDYQYKYSLNRYFQSAPNGDYLTNDVITELRVLRGLKGDTIEVFEFKNNSGSHWTDWHLEITQGKTGKGESTLVNSEQMSGISFPNANSSYCSNGLLYATKYKGLFVFLCFHIVKHTNTTYNEPLFLIARGMLKKNGMINSKTERLQLNSNILELTARNWTYERDANTRLELNKGFYLEPIVGTSKGHISIRPIDSSKQPIIISIDENYTHQITGENKSSGISSSALRINQVVKDDSVVYTHINGNTVYIEQLNLETEHEGIATEKAQKGEEINVVLRGNVAGLNKKLIPGAEYGFDKGEDVSLKLYGDYKVGKAINEHTLLVY